MTGRGPCSAMRLSICERNYASPRNIGVGAALGIVHRECEGLLARMLNAPATRPKDARIARHWKEFRINRQTKRILRAVGTRTMRKLVLQAATPLLAQEPLPGLDIFGRHKSASAVETRPSNQRNTRCDAVHKEPPGRTVPHIIAYEMMTPNEKGPTSFEVSPWTFACYERRHYDVAIPASLTLT